MPPLPAAFFFMPYATLSFEMRRLLSRHAADLLFSARHAMIHDADDASLRYITPDTIDVIDYYAAASSLLSIYFFAIAAFFSLIF